MAYDCSSTSRQDQLLLLENAFQVFKKKTKKRFGHSSPNPHATDKVTKWVSSVAPHEQQH